MSLASGIRKNVSGMVLNTAISIVATILLARYCEAYNFGVFNFVISNLVVLILAVSLNMDAAISYTLVQKTIAKEKLAALALLAVPIVLIVAFLLLQIFHLSFGFFDRNLLVPFSMLFIGGNLSLSFFAPFYQAEGLYNRVNRIGFIFNSCLCILCVFFLRFDSRQEHLKLFAFLYGVVYFLYGLSLCVKPATLVRHASFLLPQKQALHPFFKYAVSALAANLLFLLVYRIDFWFVQAYCSEADLGNYMQASKLGQLFLLIPTFIATPVFFAAGSVLDNRPSAALSRITRWIFVVNAFIMASVLFLGYWLFALIYGPTFNKIFSCLLGLAVGIIALSVNRIICAFWAKMGLVRYNIIGNSLALAAIIILDAVFIRRYGVEAAAVISSIGYVLFLSFNLYLLKRKYHMRLWSLFIPERSDIAFLKTHFLNRI